MGRSRNLASLAISISSTGTLVESGIDTSVSLGGVDTYDSAGLLPLTGITNGDQAFVANRLYISNGSGWYNVGLVNLNPSINTGPAGTSYILDSNSGIATSISLSATDSDGTPIIWSYNTSDSAYDLATFTNDSNGTFTVSGKSLADILSAGYDSTGGSFTVNFRASDGISFDQDSATFSISYYVAPATSLSDGNFTSFTNVATITGTGGSAQYPFHGLDIDGDTIVLGEHRYSNFDGRVQVYHTNDLDNQNWTLQQTIDNPDTSPGQFGWSVSLKNDVLIVGAFVTTINSVTNAGQVMVYTRDSSTWSLQGYINSPDTSKSFFGDDVKLEPVNGEYLVVSHRNANKAYVYRSTSGWASWSGPVTIDPAGDGDVSAFEMGGADNHVSAYNDTIILSGIATGSYASSNIVVYTTSDNGASWNFQKELVSPNADGGRLGYASDIYDNVIVAGAYIAPNGGYQRGRVYSFVRSGDSWSSGSEIVKNSADIADSKRFGSSINISGNNVLISDFNGGQTYVYRTSDGGDSWGLENKITSSGTTFGRYSDLQGNLALIGEPGYSTNTGRAYLYKADSNY